MSIGSIFYLRDLAYWSRLGCWGFETFASQVLGANEVDTCQRSLMQAVCGSSFLSLAHSMNPMFDNHGRGIR